MRLATATPERSTNDVPVQSYCRTHLVVDTLTPTGQVYKLFQDSLYLAISVKM